MLIILAMKEAEIRRIVVQSQPRANSSWDTILKKSLHQKRAGGVAQGVGRPWVQTPVKKKKNYELLPHADSWKRYTKGKKSVLKDHVLYDLTYMKRPQ
jgi:hypothetical protein